MIVAYFLMELFKKAKTIDCANVVMSDYFETLLHNSAWGVKRIMT